MSVTVDDGDEEQIIRTVLNPMFDGSLGQFRESHCDGVIVLVLKHGVGMKSPPGLTGRKISFISLFSRSTTLSTCSEAGGEDAGEEPPRAPFRTLFPFAACRSR